ncbi:hypothetical protein CEXT_807031 [Caerostris extrusa]|uniref:Uncharacterized protein n=1 Tax=Caerostris extrusa TaxID=172846 RepID=A0AAV4QLM9_CAEEX|nr:hypothetical protein CEXT_807031 [Caerostris extrusa]
MPAGGIRLGKQTIIQEGLTPAGDYSRGMRLKEWTRFEIKWFRLSFYRGLNPVYIMPAVGIRLGKQTIIQEGLTPAGDYSIGMRLKEWTRFEIKWFRLSFYKGFKPYVR